MLGSRLCAKDVILAQSPAWGLLGTQGTWVPVQSSSQSHAQLTSHGKFLEIYQKFFCLFTTLTFNSTCSICARRCICRSYGVTNSVMPCPASGAQLSTEHQKLQDHRITTSLRQTIARSADNSCKVRYRCKQLLTLRLLSCSCQHYFTFFISTIGTEQLYVFLVLSAFNV